MPGYTRARKTSGVAANGAEPIRLIPYGGDALRVLDESDALAFCELAVPPRFAGPPPHIHHAFDEAIYVLDGELLVTRGHEEPRTVLSGMLFLATRGIRHTFSNPTDQPVKVLGVWSPGSALTFMEDIGAALPASGPPDLARVAEIYRRHNSEVAP